VSYQSREGHEFRLRFGIVGIEGVVKLKDKVLGSRRSPCYTVDSTIEGAFQNGHVRYRS